MSLKHLSVKGSWFLGVVLLLPSPVHAECRVNAAFGTATHFLVTGIWKTAASKMYFEVPGASVGSGSSIVSDSIDYAGGNKTLSNHLRLRLRVKNNSSSGATMHVDSSSPLSCTNCASSATIPFSKLSWTEGQSAETRGQTPGAGQFNNGVQTLVSVAKNTDNIFNLQFDFANDEIYPAGTYEGRFWARGVPQ